ncbi:hypothetical protein B0H14DRAFT_2586993 [Mycena olivaceomarginata]|nr:hypothetical protein B0H14DRAFT_2586993 [Mycena olivaceomarginata]
MPVVALSASGPVATIAEATIRKAFGTLNSAIPKQVVCARRMATLVPLAAPDAGFPVHAAKDPPPMLPLHQRLTLNQDALFDRVSALEVYGGKTDGATMARDIYQRAQESLRLDSDELFPSGSDSDSMPDLVSIYSGSSDSNDGIQALEQGICELCLERQHTSALDCSLFGIERAVREVKRLSDIWEDKEDSSGQGDMQMEADDPLAPTMTSAGTIALLERDTEGMGEMSTGTNSDEGDGNGNIAVGIIRTASPVQRGRVALPSFDPRDPWLCHGSCPRCCCTCPARYPLATLQPTAGGAHTRDFWSSSPSPPSSDPSSPYDNDEYADEEEETREYTDRRRLSPGNWSPAVSDGRLTTWEPLSLGHNIASDEDSDADSREELEAHAELPTATESEAPSRVAPRNPGATQLVHELMRWIYEGKAHQQTHLHFEDEMGCEPANSPSWIMLLWQPREFPTYAVLRPPPYGLNNYPPIPDDTQDSDSSSASLDPSLPGRSLPLAVTKQEAAPPDDFEAVDVQQSVGSKRKNPDGETGGVESARNAQEDKWCGRALYGGGALAILEAGCRIEDMVWHRYGITDHSIPARFLHHPLLFDVEVAKLQTMWHILQRNGRIKLADALHELLSIKLRNEYVVSHILNAGYLDYNYPEYESSYEDLLDDPETLSNHRQTFSEYQMHQYDADSEDQDSESSGGFLYPGVRDKEVFIALVIAMAAGSVESAARIQEHLHTYMAPDPNINTLGLAL